MLNMLINQQHTGIPLEFHLIDSGMFLGSIIASNYYYFILVAYMPAFVGREKEMITTTGTHNPIL